MTVRAELVRVDRSADPAIWLELHVPATYRFEAGQYLTIVSPTGNDIPLSIASPPQQLPNLSVRFQPTPGDPLSDALASLLDQTTLTLSDAQGDVCGFPGDTPLLVIAGGSGIAQAFSLAADRGDGAVTTVLWCVDDAAQASDVERFNTLQNTTIILKADPRRDTENAGWQWLTENTRRFAGARVVLAGSPAFVYAMTDLLLALGLDKSRLASDVYAYAPRP